MEKDEKKLYKLATGPRFQKVLKAIATLGLGSVIMLGATFGIAGCTNGNNTSGITPPDIVNPTPDKPENPDQPVDPTPDNPENPDNPDVPVDPDNPDDPNNPDTPVDPDVPVQPEFELNEETKAKIEENLQGVMAKIAKKMYVDGNPVLLQAYLRKDDELNCDRIGIVQTNEDRTALIYQEVLFKTVKTITWEYIYKNGFSDNDLLNMLRSEYYCTTSGIHLMSKYDEKYFAPSFKKVFELSDEDFNSRLFAGWTYSASPNVFANKYTYIQDNIIYTKEISIQTKPGYGLMDAYLEYYLNATDDSKWRELPSSTTVSQLISDEYYAVVENFNQSVEKEDEIM